LLPSSWIILRAATALLVVILVFYWLSPKRLFGKITHPIIATIATVAMMLLPVFSLISICGWLRNRVNETVGEAALLISLAIYIFGLYPFFVERIKPHLDKYRQWSEKDSDHKQ
ncbi:MAG: hypothetical protein JOZ08_11875, partial [Verrucomicrobia bacterium]|nr:hypothetical protein [Verrucomicrobiota bacterium]